MSRAALLLLLGLVGCGPVVSSIVGCFFEGSLGTSMRASNHEVHQPPGCPDEVYVDAGTWVSGAHDTGRLVLYFSGAPVSTPLPRDLSDGGCGRGGPNAGDYILQLRIPDAGEVISDESISATLAVSRLAPTDAGTPTRLKVTGITSWYADGGSRAIADREFDLLFP